MFNVLDYKGAAIVNGFAEVHITNDLASYVTKTDIQNSTGFKTFIIKRVNVFYRVDIVDVAVNLNVDKIGLGEAVLVDEVISKGYKMMIEDMNVNYYGTDQIFSTVKYVGDVNMVDSEFNGFTIWHDGVTTLTAPSGRHSINVTMEILNNSSINKMLRRL